MASTHARDCPVSARSQLRPIGSLLSIRQFVGLILADWRSLSLLMRPTGRCTYVAVRLALLLCFVCLVFCFPVRFVFPASVFVAVCFSFRFPYSFRFVFRCASSSTLVLFLFLGVFFAFSSPFPRLFLAFFFFFLPLFFCGSQVSRQPYSTSTAQLSSAQLSPAQPSRLPLSIDIHPRANERLNRRPTGWPINWLQRTDGQTDRTNAMYLAATSDPDLVPLCFVSWRDVARHGETRQAMKGARCSPCPPSALHSAATPAQANWQGRARYRPFAHRHARRQGGGRGGGEGHG